MRKRIQIILAALLVLSMAACAKTPAAETEASALSGVQDGVYEGVGTGHGGEVNVEVEIKQEKITQVSVKEHQETAGISDKAFPQSRRRLWKRSHWRSIRFPVQPSLPTLF